jgi:hypothetical protein
MVGVMPPDLSSMASAAVTSPDPVLASHQQRMTRGPQEPATRPLPGE